MPDPNALGIILVAVAIGAVVLRLLAVRTPGLRLLANVATLAIAAVLVGLIGLFASSVAGGFISGLPD
jgi:hypothetical protein